MKHDDESNNRRASGPYELPDLPPDLRALDQELRSMEIRERESFGPELEAELTEAWKELKKAPPRRTARTHHRVAVAAGLATLLLVSLGVPPARAGLVRFLVAVQTGATEVLNLPAVLERPEVDVAPPESEFLESEPSVFSPPPAPPLDELLRAGPPGTPAYTVPALLDRDRAEGLFRSVYPEALQERGVGGTPRLLLWIDDRGRVAEARLKSSSGLAELDRAALAAAPALRFRPASQRGQATGTWMEFDVAFEPGDGGAVEKGLPTVRRLDAPEMGQVGQDLDLPPEWMVAYYVPPAPRNAREMLQAALEPGSGDRPLIDELLEGGPPTGPLSLRWRDQAVEALEQAIIRDPSNPAPFLALARVRRKQGLRSDALRLYQRGIDRVLEAGRSIPPEVVADLHFERAKMLQEDWLPWRRLGDMPTAALQKTACIRGPSPPSSRRYASGETLVAWNFRCPGFFDELMRTRLELLEPLKEAERGEMVLSLYDAVEADPGHTEANTALLLHLAEEERWKEVLENAHYFLSASNAHPNAQLLIGIALHRLGRSQSASVRFHQALAQLPSDQVGAILDVTPLLEPELARRFARLEGPDREEAVRAFWAPLDPLLTTAVNEREVEHLARAAYALLRFGGPDTDPGRVWIRYGKPGRVHAFGQGTNERTEFWDYGPGPDMTLRRPASELELSLTSETETYLEQLREVFPHRYAPSASEVLPLAGQRARFRAESGVGLELEIHTQVPEELLGELTDVLELGAFLLSSDGGRWTVERKHIPAEAGPLHLRIPVRRGANQVVVELYEPETGRAAALRSPVSASELAGKPGEVQLSDLLFVAPAAPYNQGALRSTASWVRARTGPGVLEADEAGVVLEIYDLPRGTVTYFLRAVLENLDTGVREPVGVKPAGEIEFRPVWERKRRGAGRIGEYMTLDLKAAQPGSYLLRVEVSAPDQGVTVERSKALDVG